MVLEFAAVAALLSALSFFSVRYNMGFVREHLFRLVNIFSPIPVVLGVSLFVWIKNIEMPTLKSGGVFWAAQHTLGVYLFHENPRFQSLIWDGVFRTEKFCLVVDMKSGFQSDKNETASECWISLLR